MRANRLLFATITIFFLFPAGWILAADPGDAQQLLSYRVTAATMPDVMDGQIAASTDPTDWSAAYVRLMTIAVDGITTNDTRLLSFLIGNDSEYLYISAAVELQNASTLNRLSLFFDQATRGTLDGSPGSPGEYYVTMLADGSAPVDGNWNGSAWTANSVSAASGLGLRKGAGGLRLYNFELKIPLKKSGNATNSYLNINSGDELGIQIMVTDNSGNQYFWYQTNANTMDPSATSGTGYTGWGEIQTIGSGLADRDLVALYAKDIIPTIDGDISSSNEWRFSFKKDIVFTDFAGNAVDGTLRIKEQNTPDDILLGIVLDGVIPVASDYLAVYFEQGGAGGDLNYILTNGGDTRSDHAVRMTGTGTYQDYYFDTNNWVADVTSNGSGAASTNSGDWEVEFRVPLSSGDASDLDINSGDLVGFLLKYYDSANSRSYWWSATINSERLQIDPVDPVYNALGWGILQTGGPFIQPIYPEEGDTLSGEYPLAVYTIDPSDVVPETGIDYVGYEIRKENPLTGYYTVLLTGDMTKIEDDDLAFWTGTLNTKNINETSSTPLRLIYKVYDGEIDTVAIPIDIYIDNEGTINIDDPSLSISSPSPNSVLSGIGINITFSSVTPSPVTLDTIRVYIDGSAVQTYTPSGVSTYSNTYSWNSTSVPDGSHIIQIWAKNSLGLANWSPVLLVTTQNSPSVVITVPTAGSLLRGTVAVGFTAAPVSPSTISSAKISIDGGTWNAVNTPPPAGGGAGSHSWNTTLLADGSHSLQVHSTDNTGKTGTSDLISVLTDNTPPTGPVTANPELVKNGDTVTFTYYAMETELTVVMPAGQLLLLDNQASSALNLTDPENDGVYTGLYTLDNANTVTDGAKILTVTVTDGTGNTYNPQVTITLDNTAPVFMSLISLDADNVYQNGETVLLRVTFNASGYTVSADLSTLDLGYVPGSESVNDNGDGTYGIRYTISESNTQTNGSYPVNVTARDAVGLSGSGSIALILDNTGPAISALALTDADDILNTNDVITATVTDLDADIISAEYFVDLMGAAGEGTTMTATDGSFNSPSEGVTAILNIAALDDGSHSIYVRGQDVSGKWGVFSALPFIVDRNAPLISALTLVYPEGQSSARNGQTIRITAQILEPTTQLDMASVLLKSANVDAGSATGILMVDDGTAGDLVSSDGIFTGTLTVTSTATGTFGFTMEASDIVPNTRILNGIIVLDNIAPVLTSLVCLDADTVYTNGETILLQATFDAPGYHVTVDFSAMDSAYVTGAETVQDNGDGTYEIRYTLSTMNPRPNGAYSILVTGMDGVGLSASGNIDLYLDNSGPVVSGLALSDSDDIINMNDVITATVTDPDMDVQAAEYFVDAISETGEGTSFTASDGNFDSPNETITDTLDITGLSEASHTLYVRGRDISGKWGAIVSLPFTVDRIAPMISAVNLIYPLGQIAARNGQIIRITAQIYEPTTLLNPASVLLRAASVDAGSASGNLMVDEGTGGDMVSGDGIYTGVLTVTTHSTGVFGYTVEAADILPNTRTVTGSVEIDNTAPIFVRLVSLDPDSNYMNGETVLLLATFDAPGYRVTADFSTMDTAYVPGSETVQDQGNDTYLIRYTLSTANSRPNGLYTITVTGTDGVGLSDSGTIDLLLDNSGPAVSGQALADADDILNSDDVITATISDADAQLRAAEFFIDAIGEPGEGIPLSAVDGNFDSQSEEVTSPLSISGLSEGRHTLYIRGQDISGKWGVIVSLPFTVDRVAPTIEIVKVNYEDDQRAARNGQTISISALVKDQTTQPDISTIRLFAQSVDIASQSGYLMVDNGTGSDKVAQDGVFTGTLTVTSVSTGNFPFTIRAADIVPNSRQVSGIIRLDNQAPVLTMAILPVPDDGVVFVDEVIVTGTYYDLPDSTEVREIQIHVQNANGDHINSSPIILPPIASRTYSQNIQLVEGENRLTVLMKDYASNVRRSEKILTNRTPSFTQYVDQTGLTIHAPDGTTIIIPEDAILKGMNVSVQRVSTENLPEPVGDITLFAMAYNFQPEGLVFHQPVTISLAYNDADLDIDQDDQPDFSESRLDVFYLDGNIWRKTIALSRNPELNQITFTTNHFSVYAIGNASQSESFKFYWTHNPFQPDEGTIAVIDLIEPGTISLKIYDLAGDRVRTLADQLKLNGSTQLRWDGLNDFDRYVGSGIYIYILEFENVEGTKQSIKKPIGVVK